MDVLLRGDVVLLLVMLTVVAAGVLSILDAFSPAPRRRVPRVRRLPASAPVRPAAPIWMPEDRATIALRVGLKLLERALAEPDPASVARLTMLHRAVACLQRGLESAPADQRLTDALAEVRAALGQTERAAVA